MKEIQCGHEVIVKNTCPAQVIFENVKAWALYYKEEGYPITGHPFPESRKAHPYNKEWQNVYYSVCIE